MRDRYGRHPLGQNLLLARRLVEAGVGFVTVNGWAGPSPDGRRRGRRSSSWDMHGGDMGMGNAFGTGSYGMGWCLPRLDEALSALLTDLQERGLLERTLVVVVGEFGRTPKHQHARASPAACTGRTATPPSWPAAASAAARSTASPTRSAAYVKDRPVRPAGPRRDDLPRPRRAARDPPGQGRFHVPSPRASRIERAFWVMFLFSLRWHGRRHKSHQPWTK